MARVFRQTYTQRLPDGQRVKRICRKWYIEYVDATGRPRRVPGYTDKRATEAYMNELQTGVDREKAGIIDRQSVELSAGLTADIQRHTDAYRVHLQASGVSGWHLSETTRRLRRVTKDCGFGRLLDIKAESIQLWVTLRTDENMSPRTVNTYTGSLRAFVRWCVADGRMLSDPLVTLAKLDETTDVRRVRRALTEDEVIKLLDIAERRPLLDAMTIRRGLHKGQLAAKVKPENRVKLERLGRERRLIYMTMVLTGLRKGELAGLVWGDLSLDDGNAWLTVRACIAKNRKTESLPVRADLADELRTWRSECGNPRDSVRVFTVPDGLIHILKRDLRMGGIDPDGVDVHALRHTTATHLVKGNVAPRTAQTLMRHSDIRLTLNTYTDPRLLDTVSALDALPSITRKPDAERQRATGTYDTGPVMSDKKLGVSLGGNVRPSMHSDSEPCANSDGRVTHRGKAQVVASAGLSNEVRCGSSQRANGLEPSTFSLEG